MATGDFIEFHRDNDKRRESLFFVRLTLRRCGEKEEKKRKKGKTKGMTASFDFFLAC